MRYLFVGSDHAGYKLKVHLLDYIERNYMDFYFEDFGCRKDEQPVDYPEYAYDVACAVVKHPMAIGLLVCGTGVGMSIVANKIAGIRAVVSTDVYSVIMAREHNDANILCLGERIITKQQAELILTAFLKTEFSNEERHIRRILSFAEIGHDFSISNPKDI